MAKVIFCFIEASLRVLLYHMQKHFFGYLYLSGESQKLCGDLKKSDLRKEVSKCLLHGINTVQWYISPLAIF